jgi:hypothetical protein
MENEFIVCQKCGEQNPATNNYCKKCTAPLKENLPPPPQQFQQQFIPPKKKSKGCLIAVIIVVAVIILIIIIAVASNAGKSIPTDANGNPTASNGEANKTYGINEPVTQNGITMTLASVTQNSGSEYNKPADGKVFLLCEFNIDNNANSDLTISSMLCFEAYVDTYATSLSFTALIEKGSKQQLDGKVASGKKMNGVIAYEVPKDWKELEIQIKPDVLSFFSGKTIFKVANK